MANEELETAMGSLTPWEGLRAKRTYESGSITTTVRRVCKECNGGWMGRLEGTAESVLAPLIFMGVDKRRAIPPATKPVVLTPESQRLLTTWALKTAFVADCVYPERSLAGYLPSDFHIHNKPPRDCLVSIAAPGTPNMIFATRFFRCRVRLSNFVTTDGIIVSNSESIEQPGVLVSLGMFRLMVQVLFFDGRGFRASASCNEERRIECIWPARGEDVAWPPAGEILSVASASSLVEQHPHLRQR